MRKTLSKGLGKNTPWDDQTPHSQISIEIFENFLAKFLHGTFFHVLYKPVNLYSLTIDSVETVYYFI